jgi:hypothetical protein
MASSRFLDALRDHPVVADGAMGTQLYERGILFTHNYEEINLSRPDLIRAIHREYLKAGAQLLVTNTFGANRPRLTRFNLEGRARALNEAGVTLAREAIEAAGPASAGAFVGGSMGPSGLNLKGLTGARPRGAWCGLPRAGRGPRRGRPDRARDHAPARGAPHRPRGRPRGVRPAGGGLREL